MRFEDELCYDLCVLITLRRERMFAILVDKDKIEDEIKCTKRERKDQERAQSKVRKDLGPSSSV